MDAQSVIQIHIVVLCMKAFGCSPCCRTPCCHSSNRQAVSAQLQLALSYLIRPILRVSLATAKRLTCLVDIYAAHSAGPRALLLVLECILVLQVGDSCP
jgi:hypothetical protein